MASNNRVQTIYNSRMNLLSILETIGYNTEPYSAFSVSEIDERMKTNQLDMELQKNDGTVAYIKYLCGMKAPIKGLNIKILNGIIEDLYVDTQTLTAKDTLILIIDGEPNDSLITRLEYLYDHEKYFVVCHNIVRLQFNILNHKKVPQHEILSEQDVKELMIKYNLNSNDQIPEIGRFDPVALALCMRPGQVCKIYRPAETSGISIGYRTCI
jgi:DNA-directed RNA polymerase subunit H (RpoH/RPB5)